MNTSKKKSITIPRATVQVLEKMAREEKITKSQLLQKALRGYRDARQWKSYQNQLSSRARIRNIRTEDDVERLVDEFRQ